MQISKSSAQLHAFYKAYAKALEDGCWINLAGRHAGLCQNLFMWLMGKDLNFDHFRNIEREMHKQFNAAGLSYVFPFNPDNDDYQGEAKAHTCHLNPQRIAWVFDRIQDVEEGYVSE